MSLTTEIDALIKKQTVHYEQRAIAAEQRAEAAERKFEVLRGKVSSAASVFAYLSAQGGAEPAPAPVNMTATAPAPKRARKARAGRVAASAMVKARAKPVAFKATPNLPVIVAEDTPIAPDMRANFLATLKRLGVNVTDDFEPIDVPPPTPLSAAVLKKITTAMSKGARPVPLDKNEAAIWEALNELADKRPGKYSTVADLWARAKSHGFDLGEGSIRTRISTGRDPMMSRYPGLIEQQTLPQHAWRLAL